MFFCKNNEKILNDKKDLELAQLPYQFYYFL